MEKEKVQETKQEKFKRLAVKRVNVITKHIRLLGNCSNKSNYEYTEEQASAIFTKLEDELNKAKGKYACVTDKPFTL